MCSSVATVEMQVIVDSLSKYPADSVYFDEVVDSGTMNTLQSPKLSQQFPAAFWSQSWNLLQAGCFSCLGASLPMSGNGKAMRLVPDLLDQEQCR